MRLRDLLRRELNILIYTFWMELCHQTQLSTSFFKFQKIIKVVLLSTVRLVLAVQAH